MAIRKIWVKRQNASATLIKINDDDLVDDVRDMIIRKYANSLGRTFDAPDVELRIVPRAHAQPHLHEGERRLAPDETIGRTLDFYYPKGQSVEEALIIEVPQRRTPKASPRVINHLASYHAPQENDTSGVEAPSYFPPMVVMSPHQQHPGTLHRSQTVSAQQPHTISVLTTGQVPDIPSPGGSSTHRTLAGVGGAAGGNGRNHHHRPKANRTLTASPTLTTTAAPKSNGNNSNTLNLRPRPHRSRASSEASDVASTRGSNNNHNNVPVAPALPAVGAPESSTSGVLAPSSQPTISSTQPRGGNTSTNSTTKGGSNTPGGGRKAKRNTEPKALTGSHLPPSLKRDESIPPINVLIVEDNIINLRLLEAFMRRLKVRWASAMNGREALTKWRQGGFHLVLMDIQLPVMNGLEATKEIRRLERLNGIGVFASSAGAAAAASDNKQNGTNEGVSDEDRLDRSSNATLFKSPVIIVALTASSLQSDRNEALAAGCNDFLTKPVSYPWLERKVMEWGCMQALIDFDGWRKWKDFASGGGGGADNSKDSAAASGGKKGTGAGKGKIANVATTTTATAATAGAANTAAATVTAGGK